MKKITLLSYLAAFTISTVAFGNEQQAEVIKPSQELLEEIQQHPDAVNKKLCQQLIKSWTNSESTQEKVDFKETIKLSEVAEDFVYMDTVLRPHFIAQLYSEFAETINAINLITKEYSAKDEYHQVYQTYSFTPIIWNATESVEKFKELSPMEQKTILSLWLKDEASFEQLVDLEIEDIFFDCN